MRHVLGMEHAACQATHSAGSAKATMSAKSAKALMKDDERKPKVWHDHHKGSMSYQHEHAVPVAKSHKAQKEHAGHE